MSPKVEITRFVSCTHRDLAMGARGRTSDGGDHGLWYRRVDRPWAVADARVFGGGRRSVGHRPIYCRLPSCGPNYQFFGVVWPSGRAGRPVDCPRQQGSRHCWSEVCIRPAPRRCTWRSGARRRRIRCAAPGGASRGRRSNGRRRFGSGWGWTRTTRFPARPTWRRCLPSRWKRWTPTTARRPRPIFWRSRGAASRWNYLFLTCFADYAVTNFLLGSGTTPTTVTVAYDRMGEAASYDLYVREHDTGTYGTAALQTRGEYETSLQAPGGGGGEGPER